LKKRFLLIDPSSEEDLSDREAASWKQFILAAVLSFSEEEDPLLRRSSCREARKCFAAARLEDDNAVYFLFDLQSLLSNAFEHDITFSCGRVRLSLFLPSPRVVFFFFSSLPKRERLFFFFSEDNAFSLRKDLSPPLLD